MLLALSDVTYVLIGRFKFLLLKFLYEYGPWFQLNTEWTQIEVIDLINDGTGLGFGIIGGRSTGVVVKTILPGGVAHVVSTATK